MLDKNAEILEDVPLALVPSSFMVKWKKFVTGRGQYPQPELFDNRQFLCQHDQLSIDANSSSDLLGTATVIRQEDYNVLVNEL